MEVARQAASILAESGDLVIDGIVSSTGQQVQVGFDVPVRTRFELADDPLRFVASFGDADLDRAELTELGLGFYRVDTEPDVEAALLGAHGREERKRDQDGEQAGHRGRSFQFK